MVDYFPSRSELSLGQGPISSPDEANSATISQTDTEVPSRQDMHRQANTDYESGVSFRAGSSIIGVSYVHLAIFILFTDSIGITATLQHLAFSFLVFYPALQMTWTIYVSWLPRLHLRWKQKAVFLDILFLTLILIMTSQMSDLRIVSPGQGTGPDPEIHAIRIRMSWLSPIEAGSVCTAMLLLTYIVFVTWLMLDIPSRSPDNSQLKSPIRLWRRGFAMGAGVILAVVCFLFGRLFTLLSPWFSLGPVFCGQILVYLVEFKLQTMTQTYSTWMRAGTLVFLLAVSLVVPWITYTSFFLSVVDLYVTVLITCPIWIGLWILYDVVCSWRAGMAMTVT